MGCLSLGSQLVLSHFDKGIELINVLLEFFQLGWKGGKMTTKDSGGGLGVNVRAPNDDLDQEVGRRHGANVPGVVPHLDLAKARESQGCKDALDHLDVHLGSSGWLVDEGLDKGVDVVHGELTMVDG